MNPCIKEVPAFDGVNLYIAVDTVENSKGVVIVGHGAGSDLSLFQYANVAQKFNEAGFTTYRYDQRGHGKSGGERTYLESFKDLFKDAKTVFDLAKAENPTQKIFFWGNSMGALAAAGFAIENPGLCDGFMLAVTGVGLAPVDNHEHDRHERFPLGGASMSAMVKSGDVKDFVPEITYGMQYEMEAASEWLPENCDRFQDPVFMVNGTEDRIISWPLCLKCFEKMPVKDKQFNLYGGVSHVIYGSDIRDSVIERTVKWLYERL